MKKITVIIQQNKFEQLKNALLDAGVCGMTVINAEGFGFQKRKKEMLKDKEVLVDLQPKTVVEMVVNDPEVEDLIEVITLNTRTGRIGDGKIFVSPVEDAVRIRTGERGEHGL